MYCRRQLSSADADFQSNLVRLCNRDANRPEKGRFAGGAKRPGAYNRKRLREGPLSGAAERGANGGKRKTRRAARGRVELICDSRAGDLDSETAMPLVLITKELIANAAKHGLGRRAKMLVRVGLRKEFGGYVLSVEDDGPGFTLQAAQARSSGLCLVTMLTRQLNGTFEVERGPGARCIVRFPDPRVLN
jgi:nitrate/nitrite-specific signal transduction histidine kinase